MKHVKEKEQLLRKLLVKHGFIEGGGFITSCMPAMIEEEKESFILLIENDSTGGPWATLHPDVQSAAEYFHNQEYVDDWTIVAIYDLDEEVELDVEVEIEVKTTIKGSTPIKDGS